jgi:glyoxylate reductase
MTLVNSDIKVFITRGVAGPWKKRLGEFGCELVLPDSTADQPLSRKEFLEKIQGCHGVGGMLTDQWDEEAFATAGSQLKVVANYAVGYNNIDLDAAKRHGVVVTNTPDVLTEATADVAWGLLMMASRRFAEAERHTRAGHFHGWGPNDFLGPDLYGKTLGIIGPGRIGTATARRAMGWSMKVVYAHHREKPEFEKVTGGRRVSMNEMLRTCDFLSIHCPLTPDTHHLMGWDQFCLMKPTSVLVNTARGPVVDEKALVEALRSKRIFAAGLDVYEKEPELYPGLAQLDNVVLLPHIGSAGIETREAMANLMVDNLIAVLSGMKPLTAVG